jgi:Putative prokaryotic signal transducing protein
MVYAAAIAYRLSMPSRTVAVTTCHSPAEAMMIQAVLSAHGIASVIPGASAASVTAAAVGFSSRVLVDAEVADEASALISELRGSGTEGQTPDLDDVADEGPSDEPEVGLALTRRHRVGVTVCLSLMLTFGAGHLFHRAVGRGMVIAGLEAMGIRYLMAGHRLGSMLVVGAVLLDLLGSVVLAGRDVVRRRSLPPARLLRSSK